MLCSLAKLNDVVVRCGVVLCTCPTEVFMAHSARGPRGGERACLRGCWDGGDHVCTRRGRCAVYERLSSVAHGARSRHGCWRAWHVLCVWSRGWQGSSAGRGVAGGGEVAARQRLGG